MIELVKEYLQLSVVELVYALFLSIFIFVSLYLLYRKRETDKEIGLLQASLKEANLDRESFMANSSLFVDSVVNEEHLFEAETGAPHTLLQQELDNYLMHQHEKRAESEQEFVNLSASFVDFLKIKSGKVTLTSSPFHLDEILDALAKRLRSQLARMHVELIFDIDTGISPRLLGDPKHIGLILFHLLSNIIHYHPPSQLILHAKSTREKSGKLRLSLRVEGCVLVSEVEDLTLIFQPFSDGELDENMRIELYIARELARMMNGDITVIKSEDGKNLFNVELLIAEFNPDEKRFYHLPSHSLLGQKILIVDENPRLIQSIKTMYEYFKNEVTVISSFDLLQDPEQIQKYQAVVIDKHFLNLSLIQHFRSVKKKHKVNVTVLINAKDELHYTIPVGAADQLLVKPVTIQRVFNSIIALEEKHTPPSMSQAMQASAKSEFKEEINQKVFEDFQGKRLFIIESDKSNQAMLLSLLGRSGINITLAKNMQEGLWMLENLPTFEFILLAAGIDNEESLTLSRRIRHMNRYKGVPIIIMGSTLKEADTSAVDEHLSTPVQAEMLYTYLDNYLSVDDQDPEAHDRNVTDTPFINTVTLAARDGYEMASFDEELYKEILREFMQMYKDSDIKMNQFLVKDELEDLRQLCLDVKGVAANIGAQNLANIAAKIHASISNEMPRNLMELIHRYQPELKRVTAEVDGYLKS